MKKGMLYVSACYILWGLLPVYWKLLQAVDSIYILCSRFVWSLVFITLIIVLMRKKQLLKEAVKDKKSLKYTALSGIFICVNWGTYIWAVNHGHIVDCSLGYYMNPMIVVAISALVFREKLTRNEWLAVIISGAGVFIAVISSHTVPVIALAVGGSFAIYGALKKQVAYSSEVSMFFETLTLTPFALAFIIYAESTGKGALGILPGWSLLLVPLAGVITAVPLLLFAAGVKEVPYYFTGILMYMNPTLQLLVGICIYKEAFTVVDIVVFLFIWAGVLLMIWETMRKAKLSAARKGVEA